MPPGGPAIMTLAGEAAWQRYKVTLQYLGSPYSGWQRNSSAHLSCVQDVMERAVATFVGAGNHGPCQISSRTDAGVHALANTMHVDLRRLRKQVGDALPPHPTQVVHKALNSLLPDTVRVVGVEAVSSDWHARFAARRRSYLYRIVSGDSVAEHGRAWCVGRSLDLQSMQEAGVHVVGEHNFSTFRAKDCQAKSAIKTVTDVKIYEASSDLGASYHPGCSYGSLIHVRITANSFLYNMVRLLVSGLVHVGKGKVTPQGFKEQLEAANRTRGPEAAPPHGLYLYKVHYDDDDDSRVIGRRQVEEEEGDADDDDDNGSDGRQDPHSHR